MILVGIAVGLLPAAGVFVGFSAIVLVLVVWSSLAMAARKS